MCPKNSQCQHSQNLPPSFLPSAVQLVPGAAETRDVFSPLQDPLSAAVPTGSVWILSTHCVSLHCPPGDDVDLGRPTMSTSSFAASALLKGDDCLAAAAALHGSFASLPLATGGISLVCVAWHGETRGRSDLLDDAVVVDDVVHAVVLVVGFVVTAHAAWPTAVAVTVSVTIPPPQDVLETDTQFVVAGSGGSDLVDTSFPLLAIGASWHSASVFKDSMVFSASSPSPTSLSVFSAQKEFKFSMEKPIASFLLSNWGSSAVQSDQISSWSDVDCPFNSGACTLSLTVSDVSSSTLSMADFSIMSRGCASVSVVHVVSSCNSYSCGFSKRRDMPSWLSCRWSTDGFCVATLRRAASNIHGIPLFMLQWGQMQALGSADRSTYSIHTASADWQEK